MNVKVNKLSTIVDEPPRTQGFVPRVFKTHFFQRDCPKGASKYIVIVRDPVDAATSFYNMFIGWLIAPGEVDIKTFLERIYLPRDIPDTHQDVRPALHWLDWLSNCFLLIEPSTPALSPPLHPVSKTHCLFLAWL